VSAHEASPVDVRTLSDNDLAVLVLQGEMRFSDEPVDPLAVAARDEQYRRMHVEPRHRRRMDGIERAKAEAGSPPVLLDVEKYERPRLLDPRVWTVCELAALPSADEEYVIANGILTRGGKMLVYAKSGAGKTTLLDFLAGPLATGKPFLGRFEIDRPRRVLVVQGELSIAEMASHAQQLVGAGFDSDNLMFARMTDLKLPDGEQRLRMLIGATGAEVVAFDPWYRLFSGESSDKPESVGAIFDVCDRLLNANLIEAAIVVHHANVTGLRTAGSWMFEGWPSTILRLEKVAGVPHQRILTFEKVRAPSSTLLDERLQVALGEQGYLCVDVAEPSTGAGPMLAVQIVRDAGGQLHRKDLLARLMTVGRVKERAANKYLGEAVQQRLLEPVADGQQKLYRVVTEDPS